MDTIKTAGPSSPTNAEDEKVDLATIDATEHAGGANLPSDMKAQADRAEAREHQYTILESFRIYKAVSAIVMAPIHSLTMQAVFWSIVVSFTIIMDGYDTGLLSSFYGLPAFQQQYGDYVPSAKTWTVPAAWQVALSQSTTVGSFFGIPWGAFLSDRLGYRKAILINLALIVPLIGECPVHSTASCRDSQA